MIKKIFIDKTVLELPETRSFLSRTNVPCKVVNEAKEVFKHIRSHPDPIGNGKRILFLTRNQGTFVKKCPGTKAYRCCGYEILHVGNYCTMDCSYCILQTFFHPPIMTFFVNIKTLIKELNTYFADKTIHRFGTGEFTDSLIWEKWTDLSHILVDRFAEQSNSILELKTKTAAVKRFEHHRHNRKTIMSWSLNTPQVIATEEKGTASLDARLSAAEKCQQWGYPLSFHFDPIIIYKGWEKDYQRVINLLFNRISPDNIVWISLGMFRFMPAMKKVMENRHSQSRIVYGEFVNGLDGKYRYFKPLRLAAYRKMVSWIKSKAPKVMVYFCMEDDQIWLQTMGIQIETANSINSMLNDRVIECCDVSPN